MGYWRWMMDDRQWALIAHRAIVPSSKYWQRKDQQQWIFRERRVLT